ncbi:MAG: hypothetical protein U0521_00740 [Anaerolineae bacterium]
MAPIAQMTAPAPTTARGSVIGLPVSPSTSVRRSCAAKSCSARAVSRTSARTL